MITPEFNYQDNTPTPKKPKTNPIGTRIIAALTALWRYIL